MVQNKLGKFEDLNWMNLFAIADQSFKIWSQQNYFSQFDKEFIILAFVVDNFA